MKNNDRFNSYTVREGETGTGQKVKFSCRPEDVERVNRFLIENVRSIDTHTTKQVMISHGGFGLYTRYDIKQHNYAGGHGGYFEVLEISNPPDMRCGIVIYEYSSDKGREFTEWNSLDEALQAFEKYFHGASLKTLPGFKRHVSCGALVPWFYAVGEELLVGDYTFPDGLQDDPVFRFGKKFVVFDRDNIPTIKTCMGTRFVSKRDSYSGKEIQERIVHWHDGTLWRDDTFGRDQPRPLEEDELWITEAVQKFKQMLAGKIDEFSIDLLGGYKFTGKLKRTANKNAAKEGRYYCIAKVVGEKEERTGMVNFTPTEECPDITSLITKKYKERGWELEYLKVERCKKEKGEKKWVGVFHQFNK